MNYIQPWEFIAFMVYGIPFFLLYCIVVYQLLVNKELKSAFFTISTMIGIVDLLSFITGWFMIKIPLCPLTGSFYKSMDVSKIYNLINFGTYYLPKVRLNLCFAAAINRYMVFSHRVNHKKFWSKWLWKIIIVSFVLPMPVTFHIFFSVIRVFPAVSEDIHVYTLSPDALVEWFPIDNSLITAVYTLLTSGLTFFCNIITVYIIYLQKQKIQKQVSSQTFFVSINKAEMDLFFISLWDFALDLIFTVHQCIMYCFVLQRNWAHPLFVWLYLSSPWIFDLTFLSKPIILIKMCKQVQIGIVTLFFQNLQIVENGINDVAPHSSSATP